MSEDRMIRVDNLKLLMKERGWTKADLSKALEVSDTYAGKLVDGDKPFGEKAARSYEVKLGKTRGWLDEIHTGGQYSEETLKELEVSHIPGVSASERLPPYEISNSSPPDVSPSQFTTPQSINFTDIYPGATNARLAPVVEWARLGVVLYLDNKEVLGTSHLPVPDDASSRCKWAIVETDLPRFGIKRGYKVAITPLDDDRCCIDGELYLFETRSGSLILAEFRRLATGAFEAIPDTGLPVDSDRHGIKVIGQHMGTWK